MNTGKLIVATPSVIGDFNFHRSVVLLTNYKTSGSVGFILNKKLDGDVDALKDKFNKVNSSGKKRDLGNLAKSKPKLMTKVFNKATKNALRCTEIAMGAPLTEKEKNATKKSEINPECPTIANPSYVPYGG